MKVAASFWVVLFLAIIGTMPGPARSDPDRTESFTKIFVSNDPTILFSAPLGVRNLGMGTAGAADDSDPNNSYYNPANLQSQSSYYVTMSYNERFRNSLISLDVYDAALFGGTAIPLPAGSEVRLAFGAKFVQGTSSMELDTGTIFIPEGTGRSFSRRDWYMLLSGAVGIGLGPADVGAGISLKPYSIEWVDSQVNQWAYDAGLVARILLLSGGPVTVTPSVGLSMLNLGNDAELAPNLTEPLPRESRLGAAVRVASRAVAGVPVLGGGPILALSAIVDVVRPRDNSEDAISYGVEAGLFDTFFLRGGVIDREAESNRSTWGAGLALHAGAVVFHGDYAHAERVEGALAEEPTDAFSAGLAYDF